MKNIKNLLALLAIMCVLNACYEPFEIDSENSDKVEIPIYFAAPLASGNLKIVYDSIFDIEALGEGEIFYQGEVACFKYVTEIDLYSEMTELIEMNNLSFEGLEASSIDAPLDIPSTKISFDFEISGYKDTVTINPQDTFEAEYNSKSLLSAPIPTSTEPITFPLFRKENTLDIGDNDDIYSINIKSGTLELTIGNSGIDYIDADSLTMQIGMNPAPGVTLQHNIGLPIWTAMPTLPSGVSLSLHIAIPAFKSKNGTESLDITHYVQSVDTSLLIDLANYNIENNDTLITSLDYTIECFFNVSNETDTAIIPIPDALSLTTTIKDLEFNKVDFNYGKEVVTEETFSEAIDFFEDLPTALNITGLKLSNPQLQLKATSNLGVAALFEINSFKFNTKDGPKDLDNNNLSLNIKQPIDLGVGQTIIASEGSILVDSASSNIENIEVLDIRGIELGYKVTTNPGDSAHLPNKHNFFYWYDEDERDEKYDIKLSAEVIVPFSFYFDTISFSSSTALNIDGDSTELPIEISGDDAINFNVQISTTDFPFEAYAQIYFIEVQDDGSLVKLDSMFSSNTPLIPSSSPTEQQDTTWSLQINEDKYESLKATDSLNVEVKLLMDDDQPFDLKKGDYCNIGYKFSIGKSSAVIKVN